MDSCGDRAELANGTPKSSGGPPTTALVSRKSPVTGNRTDTEPTLIGSQDKNCAEQTFIWNHVASDNQAGKAIPQGARTAGERVMQSDKWSRTSPFAEGRDGLPRRNSGHPAGQGPRHCAVGYAGPCPPGRGDAGAARETPPLGAGMLWGSSGSDDGNRACVAVVIRREDLPGGPDASAVRVCQPGLARSGGIRLAAGPSVGWMCSVR